MLNSILVLKSLVLLNILGFIIFIIIWIKKKWFCNYVCPVGFVFDKMPHYELFEKKKVFSKLPYINKWLVLFSLGGAIFGFPFFIFFDPLLVFNGFFSLFSHPFHLNLLFLASIFPVLLLIHLVMPGLWCERLCPLGGLQLIIYNIKTFVSGFFSIPDKFNPGRRLFIHGSLGALTAVFLPGIIDVNSEVVFRPPGSIKKFNNLCLRCGSCIRICPTQVLKQNKELGFGLLTPIIQYENSYCIKNCNLCSVVCPSGSITLFSIDEKKALKIGHVQVNYKDCLLMKNEECGICKQACPYEALSFVNLADNPLQMRPSIDDCCNGCGACIIICPESCFTLHSTQ